jgi:hypothetical protein
MTTSTHAVGTPRSSAERAARDIAGRTLADVPALVEQLISRDYRDVAGFGQLPVDMRTVESHATSETGMRMFLGRLADGAGEGPDYRPFRERAAQRAEEGLPLSTMLRTYLLAARRLTSALHERARPGEEAGLSLLAGQLFAAVEELVAEVTDAYLREYEELHADRRAAQHALTRALLEGRSLGTLADQLALPLASAYTVLQVQVSTPASGPGADIVRRRRVRRMRAALARACEGGVLSLLDAHPLGGPVLLPGRYTGSALQALGPALVEAAQDQVHIGWAAAERDDVPAAARRAERILVAARTSGRPPGVYGLDDVLLDYHLGRPRDSDPEIVAVLEPLTGHPELVTTLTAHLAADRDRRRTAAALGVHPNTVDKRLARAMELTGVDLHTTRGIVLLAAALAAQARS